jgi:dihydrofolate reductase
MRKIIYSMGVSLDGYVAGPNGELDWSTPDEELHAFWNDQAREIGLSLYGRRMYELMSAFWPTADDDPAAPEVVVEFAQIWRATPKVVFSASLEHVEWNSRLARGDVAEEVQRLKAEVRGEAIDVGGPTLAASLIHLGLVDEFRPVVLPIVLGAGLPFLPQLPEPLPLELIETRTFGSGAMYVRYRLDR